MNDTRKIYIITPAGNTTGGIELCHQFADSARNAGYDAYVAYATGGHIVKADVPTPYAHYNTATTTDIEDNERHLLVLPETSFDFAQQFVHIRKALWWMSIDNYMQSCHPLQAFAMESSFLKKWKYIYQYPKYRKRGVSSLSTLRQLPANTLHLYQSHYAQYFLYRHGFRHTLPLSDYIHTGFLAFPDTGNTREDIVLYNPKKGLKFTQRLIRLMPSTRFVALQGLSRQQLYDLFGRAKLYIDFGHHPGKDRLPREAVMQGLCIITGRKGSAGFHEDVPIPPKYKFREDKTAGIVRHIGYVLAHFDECRPDFDYMRSCIAREKSIFEQETSDLLRLTLGLPAH